MPHLRDLPRLLRELDEAGRLRTPEDGSVRRAWEAGSFERPIDGSSNDYLGLGRQSVSRETVAGLGESPPGPKPGRSDHVSRETGSRAPQFGAGASRLIHGTQPEHLRVEEMVARWVGAERGLFFASGYAANVGALGALLGPEDVVLSDSLNHASLIDGIRLSRARVVRIPHLDLDAYAQALVSERPTWVVVEAYYSMDGDGPDLGRLAKLCASAGANLYVDEAHSLGLFGPGGAGRSAEAGIVPDVLMGAFGKAIGSHGAVVASSETVRTWLWNRARSFVFSTAPSPRHAAGAFDQLERARGADSLRAEVLARSARLRQGLAERGLDLGPGTFGPILGVRIGSERRALAVARALELRGILTQAIRPPTVPEGESRIRLTVTATLTNEDVEHLLVVVPEVLARHPEAS